jgi:hypothetical protein
MLWLNLRLDEAVVLPNSFAAAAQEREFGAHLMTEFSWAGSGGKTSPL